MIDPGDIPAGPSQGPFPDDSWVQKYPTLCEYLSCIEYEGGKARDPSTLVIKAQDGRILLAVNDVDKRRSLYVSASDVPKGLASVEKALNSPGADWRSWQGNKRKK